jgi:dCMP deaminase
MGIEKRPSWTAYFFEFAGLASKRSTCKRRSVGAVIVKDSMVVATGYNGPPRGISHCADVGCIREKMQIPSGQRHELCRGLHAEQNAIIQASRCGINIEGSDLYCSTKPCIICTKMIINAGIKRVFYIEDYNDPLAEEIAKESNVDFIKVDPKEVS